MFAWNPKCQNPFWHLNVVMISSPNLYWFCPSRILNRKPHYNATAGVIMIFCLVPHSCLSLSLRMNSWNMIIWVIFLTMNGPGFQQNGVIWGLGQSTVRSSNASSHQLWSEMVFQNGVGRVHPHFEFWPAQEQYMWSCWRRCVFSHPGTEWVRGFFFWTFPTILSKYKNWSYMSCEDAQCSYIISLTCVS